MFISKKKTIRCCKDKIMIFVIYNKKQCKIRPSLGNLVLPFNHQVILIRRFVHLLGGFTYSGVFFLECKHTQLNGIIYLSCLKTLKMF